MTVAFRLFAYSLIRRSQVAGRGSPVAGRRSRIAGHWSGVAPRPATRDPRPANKRRATSESVNAVLHGTKVGGACFPGLIERAAGDDAEDEPRQRKCAEGEAGVADRAEPAHVAQPWRLEELG